MQDNSREEIIKRWEDLGLLDGLSQNSSVSDSIGITNSSPCLLPITIRVAAQTIAGSNYNEIKPIVDAENRDRKIESTLNGTKYEEMKVSDHPDYIAAGDIVSANPLPSPSGILFYMDFKYGTQST